MGDNPYQDIVLINLRMVTERKKVITMNQLPASLCHLFYSKGSFS